MDDLFAALESNIIDFLCSLPDVSSYEGKKNFITRTQITEPLKSRLQNYLSDNDETFFRNLIEKSQKTDGNYKSLISILREVKAGGLGQNKKDRCDFLIKILECYNDNKAWPSILFLYKDDEWLSEFLKNITRSIANINQNILKAELGLAGLNDSHLFNQVKSLIPHIKKIVIIYSDKFNRYYDQLSEDKKEKLLETIKEANKNDKLGEILLDQTEKKEIFRYISENSTNYELSSQDFNNQNVQELKKDIELIIDKNKKDQILKDLPNHLLNKLKETDPIQVLLKSHELVSYCKNSNKISINEAPCQTCSADQPMYFFQLLGIVGLKKERDKYEFAFHSGHNLVGVYGEKTPKEEKEDEYTILQRQEPICHFVFLK